MTFRVSTDLERCQGHGKWRVSNARRSSTGRPALVVVRAGEIPDSCRGAVHGAGTTARREHTGVTELAPAAFTRFA